MASMRANILQGYKFLPRIHDHFDGSAKCVECSGACRLEGAEMAYTALLRALFEGEAYSGHSIPYQAVRHLEEIGVNVEQMRKRARSKA